MRQSNTMLCILLLVLAAGTAPAQPMGGSYTIKPSGGNYASFGTACSDLISRGYTRACTMWCYTGTYTAFGNLMNSTSDSIQVVFKAAPGERPVQTYAGYGFNTTNTDNLVFDSIWFSTGNHCIYAPTLKKMVVRNCSLVTTSSGYGISMTGSDSCRFENNVVNGNYGFALVNGSDDNVFIGNKIVARSAYGFYMTGSTYNKRNTFINNFISGYTTYGAYCAYDSFSRFYYNSFYSSSSQPNLYLNYSYRMRAVNNIVHAGSGPCFSATAYASVDTSNYNCLYTTGSYVGLVNGTNYTWSQWQALGCDVNSINRAPGYIAPPNLHIADTSACIGAGITYGGVTVDIDGTTRGSPPCIGADEVLPPHNIGVTRLLAPTGSVDSSASVTPACSVRNYGSFSETYKVRLRIGAFVDSAAVTGHAAGTNLYVTFPSWTANLPRGSYAVSCSTELAGDVNGGDDKQTGSVAVLVKDVGVVSLAVPTGSYPRDTAIRPKATWHNYGTQVASFEAWAILSNPTDARVYAQKVDVTNLAVGGNLEVGTFPPCTLRVAGNWTVRCSTFLTGDSNRDNDTLDRAFFVGRLDMAVRAIIAPTGSFDTAVAVTPTARVKNIGDAPATDVKVFFRIDSTTGNTVYRDSATRTFAAGESANVTFAVWPKPHKARAYTVRCSAYVAGDPAPANNVLSAAFTVTAGGAPPPGAWMQKTPMPAGAKPAKDGAWMAYDAAGTDAGTGRIYASRGNKQPDFFSYNPANDSWKALAPWLPGVEGKLPGKGSVGCADGNGVIYATKGNNKSGFWKYDAAANAWTQKKDVPLGVSNKRVKGGTSIVFAYKGSVGSPYLLKGYKNEFYRYDVAGDSWQTLTPAPVGGNQKWDKGSWITIEADPVHSPIYAHKAKYHEFYSYNTETDSWSGPLTAMPTSGSGGSKKSKDGGCGVGVFGTGFVYALKGGNTQEFWQCTFTTDGNSWAEKETLPKGALKKKVKSGAGVAAVGTSVYAMKGNKTNELWKYTPSAYVFEPPRHDGVEAASLIVHRSSFVVSPNPVTSGFATLCFTGPLEHLSTGALRLSVLDVSGRSVLTQTLLVGRSGSAELDLRHLSSGVYLVKLVTEGCTVTRKVVVRR